MELLFRDVTLSLSQQTILNGVSGFCRPGEMLAIMGPTGSGKTSLLNVLAGRISQIERGSIFLDGHVLNKTLKRKIVYILQQDIFFTNLTLRQTLTFMALLRLPDTMRYEEKIRRVDEIVATLDLRKCLDVRIGDQLTGGLSGGEKKIANIATELLSNPELMYID
ncbi:PREDICTED: ABC transporter G family member 14-like, partial [Priapulus caudatus]|uniref:ABC transporter G family member 14-like n=1 Tax=Priapulus caudatus TaxID=37621 RepID=A0ABM1EJV9_PRICU